MSETSDKRIYGVLDIVKLIMALLVVTLHRKIGDDSNFFIFEEENVLARLAVPFFFASSSLLFFLKVNNSTNKNVSLEKYSFKILRLFVIWTIIYIPSDIYRYKVYLGQSWSDTISEILKFTSHLWFLPALVASVVFVFFATRSNPQKAKIIAWLLFASSFIAGFKEFYMNNFTLVVNFLFSGIPYAFLGYYIANQSKRISLKKSVPLFIFFFILSFIEGYIEFYFLDNTFFGFSRLSYLPTIYFLLTICVSIQTKPRNIYLVSRKISMFIYYIHLIIYPEVLATIFYLIGHEELYFSLPAKFAATIIYITIACVFLLLLENKKGFRWLKKLYN